MIERQDSRNNLWTCLREGSNNIYTKGLETRISENSYNNLIISDSKEIVLDNIKNSFIYQRGGAILTLPIYETNAILEIISKNFSGGNISYKKPRRVQKREELEKKDIYEIEKIIENNYKIKINNIQPIFSRSKNEGIYLCTDTKNKRYIFKNMGREREKAETIIEIAKNSPDIFPSFFKTVENIYTISLKDGNYSLEEFIDGEIKEKTMEYFKRMGQEMRNLHIRLNHPRNLEKSKNILTSRNSINESSAISAYLDINQNKKYDWIIPQLEEIIRGGFIKKISGTKKILAHRDLNKSNILWKDGKAKFIDLESMGFSSITEEIIPSLILNGNREIPEYLNGSAEKLIESYNQKNGELSFNDTETIKNALKYSLIKYFTIRNIRRKSHQEEEMQLKENLKKLN
jgi:hypothetical protein